jgi:hypothetical protein
MALDDDPVDLGIAEVIRVSDAALLVRTLDDGEERWFPRSVVRAADDWPPWELDHYAAGEPLHDESDTGDSGPLWIAGWFARKEGLAE